MDNWKSKIEVIMADDQKRKIVMVVAAALILVLLVVVIFEKPDAKPLRLNQEASVKHAMLAPDDIADLDKDRVSGLLENYKEDLDKREKEMNASDVKTQRELTRVNKELEMLRDKLKTQTRDNDILKSGLSDLTQRTTVITEDPELVAYLREVRSQLPDKLSSNGRKIASNDPMATIVKNTSSRLAGGGSSASQNSEAALPLNLGIKSISGTEIVKHTGFEIGSVEGEDIPGGPKSSELKKIREEAKKAEEETFFLPAGSILSGTLLTGLDAPTNGGAKSEPWPALLRIKMEAILPNRWTLDVRECFLIAGAYGDLSSERAYMRAETISCVRTDGRAIEVALDAFGVGNDGKAGIRGRVVHKNGQLIAQSLLAGFVGGVAEATKPQAIPTLDTTQQNGRTTFNEPFFEDVMTAGAYSGASNAAEKIADYLLDVASNIFPVIEVDAGRQMDFVLQRGVMLRIR
jgi:conjugal transfer pilus assembly protein TraB